jgi:hypothetical protein
MTKLCARGKRAAKLKFAKYPSAYANAYASKICAGKIKDPRGKKKKDWGPKTKTANNGGEMKRTVKKAGLGAMFLAKEGAKGKGALLPLFGLAGMAKYMSMNKKKNKVVAPTNTQEDDYATMQELDKNKETKKLNDGGSVDMYEGHEVHGGSLKGEYGTNSSLRNYYKDILG